jgi:DNA replication protein DnaC
LHNGKTHIAVALGVEAVRARKLTYFTDCQRLVADLAHAAGKGQLERRLRFYAHLSLLIVDEVGYLDVDKQGADLLFQLVSRRYERRSTIVTTNVGMGSWAEGLRGPGRGVGDSGQALPPLPPDTHNGEVLQDQGPRAAGQGIAGGTADSGAPR